MSLLNVTLKCSCYYPKELFDKSIQRGIYALPTFENVDDSNRELVRDPSMSKAMVSALIFENVHGGSAEIRPLCREISQTVEFLQDTFEQADDLLRFTRALANAAAKSLCLQDIVTHLAPTCCEPESSGNYQALENALIAVASTNQVTLAKRLLTMGARVTVRTSLFGEP